MRRHRPRQRHLTAAELAHVQGGGILLPTLVQAKERTTAFEPSVDLVFTYQPITWE